MSDTKAKKENIRNNLLESASTLFLEKDFHTVSIRELAEHAGTSSAMINYYFKSKHGLFEEMIKFQYGKFISIIMMNQQNIDDFDYVLFIKQFQKLYSDHPNMAKFLIKTSPINTGPGSQFLKDTFEFTKQMMAARGKELKERGWIYQDVDFEVVRIVCLCLTLLPGYMQDIFKESYGEEGYAKFQDTFAEFVGKMLTQAISLKPLEDEIQNSL